MPFEEHDQKQDPDQEQEKKETYFRKQPFFRVNKIICRTLGCDVAVFLADLMSKEEFFKNKRKLVDGWFYNTFENVNRDTGLSVYKQRAAKKVLKELRILDTKMHGVPAKLYYRIDHEILEICLKAAKNRPL